MAHSEPNKPNAAVDYVFVDFPELRILQDETSPEFVVDLVTLYCSEGYNILRELTKLMEKTTVDTKKVDAFVHQLKGGSSSVGADKVEKACVQLRNFHQQEKRDGFLKTLDEAKTEFHEVRTKFQAILQQQKRLAPMQQKRPAPMQQKRQVPMQQKRQALMQQKRQTPVQQNCQTQGSQPK